jgi:hypothetical protein
MEVRLLVLLYLIILLITKLIWCDHMYIHVIYVKSEKAFETL